jgi:hypothetical protein
MTPSRTLRAGRLRVLTVLAALAVSTVAGIAPVQAAPLDDAPGTSVAADARDGGVSPQGWSWLRSDDDFSTQGWSWLR